MWLEKDINQHHFNSESQKAIINIIYTYHWATEQIRVLLSENDVTLQQFNILRILRGSDPQPLSTLNIRERMLDKMSDTSRIVDRLVLKGLVTKKMSSTDKRLVEVSIAHAGKNLLRQIDAKGDAMTAITDKLSVHDLQLLNELLDKMRGT